MFFPLSCFPPTHLLTSPTLPSSCFQFSFPRFYFALICLYFLFPSSSFPLILLRPTSLSLYFSFSFPHFSPHSLLSSFFPFSRTQLSLYSLLPIVLLLFSSSPLLYFPLILSFLSSYTSFTRPPLFFPTSLPRIFLLFSFPSPLSSLIFPFARPFPIVFRLPFFLQASSPQLPLPPPPLPPAPHSPAC